MLTMLQTVSISVLGMDGWEDVPRAAGTPYGVCWRDVRAAERAGGDD